MKTFKEYLAESKKVYSFKVKVAGEIPENFVESLKNKLDRCKVVTLEKMSSTPVQKVPLDFPSLSNMEVTVYDVVTEYPITAPEITKELKDIGLREECFRVRGSSEPSEFDQLMLDDEELKTALLNDSQYKEAGKTKTEEVFGDDYNKSFLKDLAKVAKEMKKEEGKGEYKLPKVKQDKKGTKSALGS